MACDASHLREQIRIDLDRLRGHVERDPAEFSAEEDILRPEDIKASEGVSENGGKQQYRQQNRTELALSPSHQLHHSIKLNSSKLPLKPMMTKLNSCAGTTAWDTCHLFN
jgi:hypothetical protein